MRARNLLPALIFAAACPLLAQEARRLRIEGREADGDRYTALVSIETQPDGAWRIERSAWKPEDDPVTRKLKVWVSTEVVKSQSGQVRKLAVTFVNTGGGLCEALLSPVEDHPKARIEYELRPDGTVTETAEQLEGNSWRWAKGTGTRDYPALEIVREERFERLFGGKLERYEASGVVHARGAFYVVFDNSTRVAVVDEKLSQDGSKITKPLVEGDQASDFEGLTYDPEHERFLAVVEADKHHGEWRGQLWELDEDLDLNRTVNLPGELPSGGKGYEGLAFVSRGGESYLLALLEGNNGESDTMGRERGNGRIDVFRRVSKKKYELEETLVIPPTALFEDYSGLSVDEQGRVAIVSQSSSLLWVGQLSPDAWEMQDEGRVFTFPRLSSRILFGAVEGVSWIDARTLVVVSDRSTGDRDCAAKDEAIHVVRLPD